MVSRLVGVGSLMIEMILEMRLGMRRMVLDEMKMVLCMMLLSWVWFWSVSSLLIMRRILVICLIYCSVVVVWVWCGVVLFCLLVCGLVSGMVVIFMVIVSVRSVMVNGVIDIGGLMGCVSR